MLTILTAFLLAAAPAQEGLERAAAALAEKLSAEGPAAKLAEVAGTEAGRRALEEALRECLAWKLRPLERDPETCFEGYYFTRDEDGALHPRAERRGELESLRRSLDVLKGAYEEFHRRADGLVARIVETSEIDRRVKNAWADGSYRLALFAEYAREHGESLPSGVLGGVFEKALWRDESGKMRVRESAAEDLHELLDGALSRLTKGGEADDRYWAVVEKSADAETRRVLASPFARAFVRSRMGRAEDDGGDRCRRLLVLYGLVDGEAAALRNLRKDVEEAERHAAGLRARLDEVAAGLEGTADLERKLKLFLADEPSRAVLVEEFLAAKFDSSDPADQFFQELIGDLFEPVAGGLRVRAERFAEEGGPARPENVDREVREAVQSFAERRRVFEDMAERCADARVAELLAAPLAVPILERRVEQVCEKLREAEYGRALAAFARRYLEATGDRYRWRADRAAKAEAIVARAQEIAREMEAEAKEEEGSENP